ncbi:MAG: deoxyribodipyrimidine photo-lyase [Promethearchaeota archaeon]|nr:MAG: deoxyribodipyrimidine photo-lyase [Candidatus Lokiarchaeota archaeon]
MNENRKRILLKGSEPKGPTIYWMSRDQRINDNWALIYAQELALKSRTPLVVVFCLLPNFSKATFRHYHFMISDLKEIEIGLKNLNISFCVLQGEPQVKIPDFIENINAGVLICDFSPLKIKDKWISSIKTKISNPIYEVDAHNIIPCWIASIKQEYAAYTFRPKIRKLLPKYLEEFPSLKRHPIGWNVENNEIYWDKIIKSFKKKNSGKLFEWLKPGEKAAKQMLKDFLTKKLSNYDKDRNDPNLKGQSSLSPYIHFGQISAQRIALEVSKSKGNIKSKNSFLEELVVRRELSDNFCYYNSSYDSFEGFPLWARQTLNKHRHDKREYVYTLDDFENAKTHDDAWNAAQLQMIQTGKMHGYMRMYWGKKILEWTNSPEEALKIAIYLNDKYEIDGRDPNGYVGISWCIGGLHDRAWKERKIFGKIRYLSYMGLKRKFSIDNYINKYIN